MWYDELTVCQRVPLHFAYSIAQGKLATVEYCLQMLTIQLCPGGAMVQGACNNGHASCIDRDSSPTYDPWSFSPVTMFLQLMIKPQRQYLFHVLNKLAQSYQGYM